MGLVGQAPARRIREGGGTILTFATIVDTEELRRSGTDIDGFTPDGLSRGDIEGARLAFGSVSTVTVGTTGETSEMRDSADGANISFAGVLTADITASGANGLDTGTEAASTWYAVHVIAGGGNPVASLLSLSATAPTLPGTYTVFRRVGWVRNNGSSNFLKFNQRGSGRDRRYGYDEAEATTQVLTGGVALTWTAVGLSSFIPPTSEWAILQVSVEQSTSTTGELRLRRTGDTVAEADALIKSGDSADDFSAGSDAHQANLEMETNASQSIDYNVSDSSSDADIFVAGFADEI